MKKKLLIVLGILSLGLMVTSCKGKNEKTLVVGSKEFTENLLVSEIYALGLEDQGFQVERKQNISGTVIHKAITNKEIDLYPEYTGTGLLVILKRPMESDPDKVYQQVKEGYKKEFNLVWLDQSQANDSQGLVLRTDVAQKLGIRNLSDLQKNAGEIRFASQGTFDHRDDGLAGLEKLYGPFNFKERKVYSNDLKYEILEKNEADLTPAYTSEGALVEKDKFTVLEDDKGFWPPYYMAPVVRGEVLEKYPEIQEVLNKISNSLDTDTMISLNAQVDLEKKDYKEVARDYYDSLQK